MTETTRRIGIIVGVALIVTCLSARTIFGAEVLVEAEAFDHYGGWLLDSQFLSEMGSPYLLAHGLGRPVANAMTMNLLKRITG